MKNEQKVPLDSLGERIARLSPEKRKLLERTLKSTRLPLPNTQVTSSQPSSRIPRRTSNDSLPLSFAQQRLWFLDQFTPGNPFYNVSNALRLSFPVNVEAMEKSYNEVARRHEALRTTFPAINGTPVQVIADSIHLPMKFKDLSHLPEAKRESEALRIATEEARRPFDLARGPLVRTSLIQLGAADFLLLLGMHHIISDGWSMDVFANEITALYGDYCYGKPSPLPELPIQYADFAIWQRQWLTGEVLESQLAYWKKQLADLPALQLPTDRPRPSVVSYRGARQRFAVEDTLCEKVKVLSQRENATVFMTLLAAFKILLHRYTGQEDLVVGVPVANRNREELQNLVGFFVNTLVLRTNVSGNPTFRELLVRVRQTALDAYAHQDLPFEKLVDELHQQRDMSRNPLFQVSFQLFNVKAFREDMLKVYTVEAGVASFDLRFDLLLGPNSLSGFFEYSTDLFDADTITRLSKHYVTLLEAITADPELRISELRMLPEEEMRQLLYEGKPDRSEYESSRCIHELFESQAKHSPQSVAVICGDEYLTYGELNRQANRLAHHLRSLGAGPDVPVGVFLTRSLDVVISLLAILKAGSAYLALDPEDPSARLAFILEDTAAPLVVTHDLLKSRLPSSARAICIDHYSVADAAEENPRNVATPDSLAYVMYTSGSTGMPKGVAVPHRAVNRLVCNTNYISLGAEDAVAQASVTSFDASTFEIWGALLHGARLVIVPKEVLLAPPQLASLLERAEITVLFVTTDLFNQLASEAPWIFRTLRTLLFGGSAVDPRMVRKVLLQGRPQRFLHVYGPTESTTFASWYEIEDVAKDGATIPIGRAISNTELHVLDRYGHLAAIGAVGELHIGGDGLARGYFRRPDMTAEKFIPNGFGGAASRLYKTGDLVRYRPDGVIDFLGRIDHQVKIRGFRVELGEIESVLRQAANVVQCAVIARKDTPGAKRIIAYVELAEKSSRDTDELQRHLKEQLPDYMVPTAFILLDTWPLTPGGKLDREALAALPAIPTAEREFTEPRSSAEKTLAAIWAQVLGLQRVSIHDNFFKLGGDSIISIQIIARANEAGLKLTLQQIFKHPTIAELAAAAGSEVAAHAEQEILEGEVPLTPIQLWFFEQQQPDLNHFNQAVMIETPAGLDRALLREATTLLLDHHDALRLRYQRGDVGWRQFYEASGGAAPFETVELGNVAPLELRTRVERRAAEAQSNLDIASGPIVEVLWFDLGERPGRLLFVIHHLAVDAVSWRVIMEDFWKAYESLARGGKISLPAKTTSFRQWATQLIDYAHSPAVRKELDNWLTVDSGAAGPVTLDLSGGENLVAAMDTVTIKLSEEETRALIHETPKAYQTQINEVLLTALALALRQSTGKPFVRIDLEGHGREPLFENVDLTRTVGWFTTMFPVQLDVRSEDPGQALKSVKEQLRRIPNRGLTYGLLRYCSNDACVIKQLTEIPNADVSFNYLGQYASTAALESTGSMRGPRNRRHHLIEIDGAIYGGQLTLQWGYSTNHHRRLTIERLAADFNAQLSSLIAHCSSSQAGGLTPSDFAKARISQKDLDKLVATVSKSS